MSEASDDDMSSTALVRADHSYLSDEQWECLMKMEAVNGRSSIVRLLRDGPAEVLQRISRFRDYEQAWQRHVLSLAAAQATPSAIPAPPAPVVTVVQSPAAPKPVRVTVSQYGGEGDENLIFWQREIDMAMVAAVVKDARQQVTYAISNTKGRAKNWALTCETTHPGCFQDWPTLAASMKAMFLPPNVAHRQRAAFLACKQGSPNLYTYVQELRQLRASMAANAIAEDVMITVLMDGMNFGQPKTALFREMPLTLDDAIIIALREDHIERQSRGLPTTPTGTAAPAGGLAAKSSGEAEPIDLSFIDLSEVVLSTFDLSAIDIRALHIKCFTCDKMGHYQRDCPRNRHQRSRFRGGHSRARRGHGVRSAPAPPSQGNAGSQ